MEITTHTLANGNTRREWRYKGLLHNPYAPAIREWNAAGVLVREIYCIDDLGHNLNGGPTILKWNDAGTLICEEYCFCGLNQRFGAPAIREWDDAGMLFRAAYYVDGYKHNSFGPAVIYYDAGEVIKESYYINGNKLSKDAWLGRIQAPRDC
jgi:antitoxin component YwqK of YwqJK toxin-antitoxin module